MDHPVRFFPYTQITEIGLLIELLEENGIAAFPEEKVGPGLDPFMAQSIQGKWLWVNKKDVERAREVLSELQPTLTKAVPPSIDFQDFEPVEGWCPACESGQIFEKKQPGWKGILAGFLSVFSSGRIRKCGNCGYHWTS